MALQGCLADCLANVLADFAAVDFLKSLSPAKTSAQKPHAKFVCTAGQQTYAPKHKQHRSKTCPESQYQQ